MKNMTGFAVTDRRSNSEVRTLVRSGFAKLLIACAALAVSATSAFAAAQGAIYDTIADGTVVNQNLYDNKADVYLNGGPQNDNANGLSDGTYYFQVTDPSGTHLLSTDPAVNRQLIVVGGRVTGSTAGGVITPLGTPHANGTFNPANGSTSVQLVPFLDTPNNGGEYKAWLIGPVATVHHGGPSGGYDTSNVTISPTDNTVLVFDNNDSKTDNFKVVSEPPPPPPEVPGIIISGVKYYDVNATGFRVGGEVGVAGFQIEVTIALSDNTTIVKTATTDANGAWSITTPSSLDVPPLPPGVTVVGFTACEVQPSPNLDGSYWMQTGPLIGDETANPHVILDNLQDYCWTGSLVGRTTDVTGIDFGNICVHQPSGGFTLGYWSNKNGQAVLNANDPAWRTLLNLENLKRANGLDYDVPAGAFGPAYKDFRTWILGANATNMAYMLSAQLTATTLDTAYKGLSVGTLVFLSSETALQPDLAACYGANVAGIGTVIAEANADLGLAGHENTTSPSLFRDHQECLKNILDNINNNKLLFVSPIPCPVVYPQ